MIKAERLEVKLGPLHVVRGVTLEVGDGEVAALVGPNGAGKTSTLRAIMGLYPHGGSVLLDGRDISGLRAYERARLGIGFSPEDGGLFPSLTVRENLLLPMKSLRLPEERLEVVYGLFPMVKELLGRKAYTLSGGQRKIVSLARAILVGRRALLLDEIFEGVSPKFADDIKKAVADYVKGEGVSLLLAESSTQYIAGFYHRIYKIERGAVLQHQ